jgi:hypothetical protein
LAGFFASEAVPEELFQQDLTFYSEGLRPALLDSAITAIGRLACQRFGDRADQRPFCLLRKVSQPLDECVETP